MRLSPILLLAALLPAGARRVLCLHGLGGSKFAFLEHHLKPLRGAAMASYRDWRPVAWEFDAIDAPLSETGGWWDYSPEGTKSYTADELVGLETSVALVEETIVSGDFCGLFGFSQGAMLASIVAARAALGEGPCSNLRFAVMCGAALPRPAEPLLHRLRDAPAAERRAMATLHCLSKEDDDQPSERGEALAACFHDSKTLWHDQGHRLPPRDTCKEIVAWMDEHGPDLKRYA